ncbi:MAG TPA: flagellar hook-associated protein FlgK [Terriglobia bacterium]|nr:flagellar hook-associated protein FlgK [Terriglobia bacterium]
MGGLTGSLEIAMQSLLAQQGALEVTSNNISNAHTPGYSRQTPVLVEDPSINEGSLVFGEGVSLQQIKSVRDNVLQLQLNQETGTQSQVNAYLGGMNQVATVFNETQGAGLQNVISQFFNSFQQLSTNPTDATLRQAVLTAGQNLATAFNQASASLGQIRTGLDQSVVQDVAQVNQLTSQIAALNPQIAEAQGIGQSANSLIDQRNDLISQLSGLVNTSVTDAGNGYVTVSTADGAPLVVGNQSFALTAQLDTQTGTEHVFSQGTPSYPGAPGTDITASIQSGDLGGLIQARDQGVASAQTNLDNLTAGIISSVNAQQARGYDLSGKAGAAFFTGSSSSNIAVANNFLSSQIAASSDGTVGSNGNALALANIQNDPIVNGQNPGDFYSNFVAGIGNQVSTATSQQTAVGLVMTQLQNQQTNISGVSLDEEAANLELYQNAYNASAQVVAAINTLTQTTINMATGA